MVVVIVSMGVVVSRLNRGLGGCLRLYVRSWATRWIRKSVRKIIIKIMLGMFIK